MTYTFMEALPFLATTFAPLAVVGGGLLIAHKVISKKMNVDSIWEDWSKHLLTSTFTLVTTMPFVFLFFFGIFLAIEGPGKVTAAMFAFVLWGPLAVMSISFAIHDTRVYYLPKKKTRDLMKQYRKG